MVIPENIVIVIGILLVVSILANAGFIGYFVSQMAITRHINGLDFQTTSAEFEDAKRRVEQKLRERRHSDQ